MKKRNIVKNVIKILMIILAIISVLLLVSRKSEKTQSQIEQASVAETAEVSKKQAEVTSRHSIERKRKNVNLQEIVDENIEVQEMTVIETQYTKIEDITISRDMDLTVRTGMSKEDFKTLISNVKYDSSKFFYDNSEFIYDLCEEYQINEIFFCGLISAESGWNIASNHRRTHNYISLMTKNGLIQYNSVEDGLIAAAKALHNNYLTEGGRFYNGKTLYGVKTKFCPASNTWVELVYGRMQQIMNSR